MDDLLVKFQRDVPDGWWWHRSNGVVHSCLHLRGRTWLALVSGNNSHGISSYYAGITGGWSNSYRIDSENYETLEEATAVYMAKLSELKGHHG